MDPTKQLLVILNIILILATVWLFGFSGLTGFATYEYSNTTMNATIAGWVGINASEAITWGIRYGSVDPGTDDNMALNDTTGPAGTNCTDYNISLDASTNVNVDIFNKADNLTDNGNSIFIENVTLEGNQTECGTNVNMTLQTDGTMVLNTTWMIIGNNSTAEGPCADVPFATAGNCYAAYWLDVPVAQIPGDYNTSYEFCGVQYDSGSSSC